MVGVNDQFVNCIRRDFFFDPVLEGIRKSQMNSLLCDKF
jgi:hypothetical protein